MASMETFAFLSKGAAGIIAALKSPILSCIAVLTLSLGALSAAFAGSATWNLGPLSGDWNTAANWMPHTVPNGPSDIATFDVSSVTDVSTRENVLVESITFSSSASAFTQHRHEWQPVDHWQRN